MGGGLVQHQQGGVAQEGPRQSQALGLASAEARAAFADGGFQSIGQGASPFVQAGQAQSLPQLLGRGLWVGDAQVGSQAVMKQVRVLGHPGHARAPGRFAKLIQATPVDANVPGLRAQESQQQPGQGGLARSAGTHQSGQRSGAQIQAELLDRFRVRAGVSEGDVFKDHLGFVHGGQRGLGGGGGGCRRGLLAQHFPNLFGRGHAVHGGVKAQAQGAQGQRKNRAQ